MICHTESKPMTDIEYIESHFGCVQVSQCSTLLETNMSLFEVFFYPMMFLSSKVGYVSQFPGG